MKNLNDMERGDAELIEASDAELEQISTGLLEMKKEWDAWQL